MIYTKYLNLIIYLQKQILFLNIKQNRSRRRLMRRKSDFTNALDQMFCQDDKKRVNAIKLIREISASIGPARVRNQLVPFLNQFLDQESSIMLVLLNQLQNFSPLLGGAEHDKILLPLLINFCLLDEKQVAFKSLALVEQILSKFNDCYLDTIKKLSKSDMNVSKQCAIILIANGVKKVPHLQSTFLDIYKSIVFSENPAFRILAAKYFKNLVQNCSNKEEICKILEIFYNDPEDLTKLLTIQSLFLIYNFNSTFVMSKLKILVSIGTWRINIRLCQYSNQFTKILNKLHFKTLIEPCYLKMMGSEDNQIRCASCSTLVSIAKNMTVEQTSTKLFPIMIKLSEDIIDFVRNEFAKNLVKVFPYFAQEKIKDSLIPLVIKFLKQSNLQVSAAILQDFKQLSKYLKAQKFQESILKPLASQLAAENWRLKIQTLDLLGKIVIEQDIYSEFIVDILMKQMKNKIEAVRIKATSVVISIMKKSPKEWSETYLIPLVIKIKDESNYLLRQRVVAVIQETVDVVSNTWLSNYRKIIMQMLIDKIPNVRMMALKCAVRNRRLLDKGSEGLIIKMRQDVDAQIKQAAKQIKI